MRLFEVSRAIITVLVIQMRVGLGSCILECDLDGALKMYLRLMPVYELLIIGQ